MSDIQEIKNTAYELLSRNLEPIQTYIIMKDLLDISLDSSSLAEVKKKMMCCKWIKELEETQESNGTWGRFHSQDSSIKRRFPTTEIAINRALALGLDAESNILGKSVNYMASVINGLDSWPDRVEKFNEWPAMTKMITAATISSIDRVHPALREVWKSWAEIVKCAFEFGEHDLNRELAAFEEITGICPTKKDSKLNKKYPLMLLSAGENSLSSDIEKAYLEWIWNNKEGIYYLTGFSMDILPEITSKEFPFWLKAIDVISDYGYGKYLTKSSMDYLWDLKGRDGLWDFGANSKSANGAKTHCGWQLASSWREEISRQIDCSIRILLVLKKNS